MCWGLLSALNVEARKRVSLHETRMSPTGPRGASNWKNRLHAMMHQPRRREVVRYIHEVVQPALSEVAEELRKQNLPAEVGAGEDDRVWVEVLHGDEIDFFYSVHPRPYEPPTFVMRDTGEKRLEKLKYYRAEVHLKEGGQDYDVMGWSKDDVIHDVLEQYQRHMHFLSGLR
jgi:choline/glycine/proline betaine transport protein